MANRGGAVMRSSALKDCQQLKKVLEEVMKTYVSVAEDLQDGGERFSMDVDHLEQRLLDVARMERELVIVGRAAEEVVEAEREYSSGPQEEGPPQLEEVFEQTLSSLREEGYDPKSHQQWREFVQRVREAEGEGGTQEEEDADIVMAQVQRSLKCPLTQQYLEDPVTSGCGHSYSRAAITQHIRNSHRGGGAKCPVCNAAISMEDLKADESLRRMVQRALRRGGRDKDTQGVVSL